jgi:hypothetical protein
MATEDKPAKAANAADAARDKARADELKAQKKVQDAIYDVTHDKDGNPKAIETP